MKYLKSFSHIIIAVVIFAGFFSMNGTADAKTFEYTCEDSTDKVFTAGTITQNLFTEGEPEEFRAEAQITSECSERLINLKTQNKNKLIEPKVDLFTDKKIYPGDRYPITPASTVFTSPEKEGQYAVRFITGVEEEKLKICKDGYKGLFDEKNVYHMYDEMMIDTDKATGPVTLTYDAFDIPNRFSVWSYSGNQLIVASGGATSIFYNPSTKSAAGSQGWIGLARYIGGGQWGYADDKNPYNGGAGSGYRGTLVFTPTPGERYYRIRVETQTGPGLSDPILYPRSGDSDDWVLDAKCS